MIIGVLGRKGSGKDTVADYVVTKFKFEKMTFAKPLKDACKILFNFTDEQLYGDLKEVNDARWGVSPRQVLQYLGTDVIRKGMKQLIPDIQDNFWVNLLRIKYLEKIQFDPNTKVIVSDVRFQNEIDMVHQMGGIVIKLIRPLNSNIDVHESEKNIDNLNGEFNIINDGTLEELYKKIDEIISL